MQPLFGPFPAERTMGLHTRLLADLPVAGANGPMFSPPACPDSSPSESRGGHLPNCCPCFEGPVRAFPIPRAKPALRVDRLFRFGNERDGVCGRKISIRRKDDKSESGPVVQNSNMLIEREKVFLLFNSIAHIAKTPLLKYGEEQRVVDVAACAVSSKDAHVVPLPVCPRLPAYRKAATR
jgi:hypothetical protein